MQITLPLVLLAIGSGALVALREGRLLLVALAVQWAGVVALLIELDLPRTIVWAEGITALACMLLLGWTVFSLHNLRREPSSRDAVDGITRFRPGEAGGARTLQGSMADQALLWVTALSGGVAGYGLARLYPLGGNETVMLAFYWVLLSAALALVLHGARDMIKLGVGLLVSVNAIALLVMTLSAAAPGAVALGLLGATRVGLGALTAYMLLALRSYFSDANLDDIFDARVGVSQSSTALALLEYETTYPNVEDVPDGAEAEAPEAVSVTTGEEAGQEGEGVPTGG